MSLRVPCIARLWLSSALDEAKALEHSGHGHTQTAGEGCECLRSSQTDSMKRSCATHALHALSSSSKACHWSGASSGLGNPAGKTRRRRRSASSKSLATHGSGLPCTRTWSRARRGLDRERANRPQNRRRLRDTKQSIDGRCRSDRISKSERCTSDEKRDSPTMRRRARM